MTSTRFARDRVDVRRRRRLPAQAGIGRRDHPKRQKCTQPVVLIDRLAFRSRSCIDGVNIEQHRTSLTLGGSSMAAPSHADTDDGKQAHSPRQIVRHLLHVPFLRNIFAACLLAALAFPLYLWLYPARSDHGSMPLLAIAAGMLTIVAAALYKAGQAMLAHQTVDAALRQVRDELEIRAKTRTRELLRANAALQRKIAEHRQDGSRPAGQRGALPAADRNHPQPGFFQGRSKASFHRVATRPIPTPSACPGSKIIGRRLVDLPGIAFSDMAEHYHRQDLALIRTARHPGRTRSRLICADGVMRDYMLFKATFRERRSQGGRAGGRHARYHRPQTD
jgi:hypothetical protein